MPPPSLSPSAAPGSLTLTQAHLLAFFFASTYVGTLYISKRTRLSFTKPSNSPSLSPTTGHRAAQLRRTAATNNYNGKDNLKRDQLEPREKQRNERWRDDEDVIRARLVACVFSTFVCCATVLGVHYALLRQRYSNNEPTEHLFEALKLTLTRLGLCTNFQISLQTLKPHLITPVLYIGSLYAMYLSQTLPFMKNWSYASDVRIKFGSWQGIRNYVSAPITEELVFRACVLVVYYLAGLERNKMVWLTPLSFGLAHVHHAWETFNVYGRTTAAAKRAVLVTCVQLTYTTLFGAYCTYLFLRTGSIYPPISAHVFCNLMGLPEIGEEMRAFKSRKYLILIVYLAGMYAFRTSLGAWTRSDNSIYWT